MVFRVTPYERGVNLDLMIDDKRVSGLKVVDLQVHIGEAIVRCGGIGGWAPTASIA